MSETQVEMPRYECHKVVHALKIARFDLFRAGGLPFRLIPSDSTYTPFEPGDIWRDRYFAIIGKDSSVVFDPGYYVVYEDGYASWSPTEAFEDDYIRI